MWNIKNWSEKDSYELGIQNQKEVFKLNANILRNNTRKKGIFRCKMHEILASFLPYILVVVINQLNTSLYLIT